MKRSITEVEIVGIYRETIDVLYGYVSRRCGGDRELAEDVTQETWLRAVREWRRSGVPEQPLAWLRTVARNLLLNQLRRTRPIPLDSVEPGEILAAVDDNRVSESAEIAAMVQHALARLPARQVRLLESFHFDNWRVAQIAESCGISERAAEGRLRRAREKLRREIGKLTGTGDVATEDHDHDHGHDYEHEHEHGHVHGHDHDYEHEHVHGHEHEHGRDYVRSDGSR